MKELNGKTIARHIIKSEYMKIWFTDGTWVEISAFVNQLESAMHPKLDFSVDRYDQDNNLVESIEH